MFLLHKYITELRYITIKFCITQPIFQKIIILNVLSFINFVHLLGTFSKPNHKLCLTLIKKNVFILVVVKEKQKQTQTWSTVAMKWLFNRSGGCSFKWLLWIMRWSFYDLYVVNPFNWSWIYFALSCSWKVDLKCLIITKRF